MEGLAVKDMGLEESFGETTPEKKKSSYKKTIVKPIAVKDMGLEESLGETTPEKKKIIL